MLERRGLTEPTRRYSPTSVIRPPNRIEYETKLTTPRSVEIDGSRPPAPIGAEPSTAFALRPTPWRGVNGDLKYGNATGIPQAIRLAAFGNFVWNERAHAVRDKEGQPCVAP